jgi:hypothetical protein
VRAGHMGGRTRGYLSRLASRKDLRPYGCRKHPLRSVDIPIAWCMRFQCVLSFVMTDLTYLSSPPIRIRNAWRTIRMAYTLLSSEAYYYRQNSDRRTGGAVA